MRLFTYEMTGRSHDQPGETEYLGRVEAETTKQAVAQVLIDNFGTKGGDITTLKDWAFDIDDLRQQLNNVPEGELSTYIIEGEFEFFINLTEMTNKDLRERLLEVLKEDRHWITEKDGKYAIVDEDGDVVESFVGMVGKGARTTVYSEYKATEVQEDRATFTHKNGTFTVHIDEWTTPMQKATDNLITHMLCQEFGDRGTWGGNRTEAIYLAASLPKKERKDFIKRYTKKFKKRLAALLNEEGMGLKGKKKEKSFELFAEINPEFAGGFNLPK